ncbi:MULTISPECIES: hypothetical protein [unclassified Micromonospora]|uniref:hypothetical protein n=1 Tax=unclassified Micromonospora TaxID=2617518 RepID=UPI001C22A0E1|nr:MULTISPECIES: hypothetical protein [unclassified Micromonospora]MBU8857754.1 hypothetical protein [Micromonospora sp. WMMB482]MDM4783381.1 hypothetical protein [Micromonospora sp. b486]
MPPSPEPTGYILRLPPPLPPAAPVDLDAYVHDPGSPVLDRVAAETFLAGRGHPGSAIAVGDIVQPAGEATRQRVTAVDHHTGLITVTGDGGTPHTVAGVAVEVVSFAEHPPVPDDLLEGLTLQQARERIAEIASDYGRYPQYTTAYFAGWVFGRVVADIHWRDNPAAPVDVPAGQRVLVRSDNRAVFGATAPPTVTAYCAREPRPGIPTAVWAHQIRLEG